MTQPLPILIVEDEEILLSFLKTALERGGFQVMGAGSAPEAIDLLGRNEFGVVVSDLRMPGESGGAELFEWVRERRPVLAPCFLFITGNINDSYAEQVRERTGAMFIEKPFRIALLIELIKKIRERNESAHA